MTATAPEMPQTFAAPESPEPSAAPPEQLIVPGTTAIAVFSPCDADIDLFKRERAELYANPDAFAATEEGYKLVAKTLREAGKSRNAIDKARLAYGADAREWVAKLNKVGFRLISRVETELEKPLRDAKEKVDAEAARIIREKEEAEAARIAAEQKAVRDAEEARWRADREAEVEAARKESERLRDLQKKIDAERIASEEIARVEREKIAAERAEFEAKQQAEREAREVERRANEEAQRLAQAKLDAERKAIDDERERLNRAKFEQEARERAEKEAAERVERQRVEAIRAKEEVDRLAKVEAEEAAAELARIEAAWPDVEKIRQYGEQIRALATSPRTAFTTEPARIFATDIYDRLLAIADDCKKYTVPKAVRKRQGALA